MSRLLSVSWFKLVVVLLALASVYLLVQTIQNQLDFVQGTRKIDVQIAELCPVAEDSFQLEVVVDNRTERRIVVEAFIFQLYHEERLIASTIKLEEVPVEAAKAHTEQLVLTTNLAPDRRPEQLNSCGFAPGWSASGRIRVMLPVSREPAKLKAKAGGS
jgi:hypothetical protein